MTETQLLSNLIDQCLDADPTKRPSSEQLKNTLDQYYKDVVYENKESIIYKQVESCPSYDPNYDPGKFSGISYVTHPEAIYTSRLLSFGSLPNPVNVNTSMAETKQLELVIPNFLEDMTNTSEEDESYLSPKAHLAHGSSTLAQHPVFQRRLLNWEVSANNRESMEEFVPEIDLLIKSKVVNDTNEIARLLKKIGQQLWQNLVNKENVITLKMADRCLSVYKIFKAVNNIAKKDLITIHEILTLKDFLFKRVLRTNNDLTDFFVRVDELHKSLRDIQCNQAKGIIFQAQEAKDNSEKVNIIKDGYRELNMSLHKLLYDITQLAIDALRDDNINMQKFAVVLLGSWAKGTATPYSDIEFCILINDHNLKLKEALQRMVHLMNFIVISLGQTALPWSLFEVPNKISGIDFDDLLKPGFQFDLGGKTPLGRSDKDYDLIQTPQKMANYINPITFENDPLLVTELIDCRFLTGNEKLYENYKQMVKKQLLQKGGVDQLPFHKRMAKVLLQIGTKNLQADLEKYKIRIDKVSDEGKLLNIKTEIYRLPDRLIEGLRINFATSGETIWDKISGLLEMNIFNQTGAAQLEFMTAVALQARLFTYLTHGSQSERLSIRNATEFSSSSEVESFLGIDDISDLMRFYQIAIPLYHFVKTSIDLETPDQINTMENFLDERITTKATICFRFMLYRQAELLLLEAQKSGSEDAHFQLFRLYFHLEKPRLAYEAYKEYLTHKTPDITDRFNLGYLKLALENHKEALEEFNLILSELADNHQENSIECVQALCITAQIESLLGNPMGESIHLKKANETVERIPDQLKNHVMIDFYISNAKWYANQKRYDRSKYYVECALEYTDKLYGKQAHTKLVDIYQQAAEIAERFNQREQAVEYRELVIKILTTLYAGRVANRLLAAYMDLANTLCLVGEFVPAQKQLDYVSSLLSVVEHELTSKAINFKLLHSYMKLEQSRKGYKSAYEYYEKAMTLYQNTLARNSYHQLQLAKFYLDAFDIWIHYDKRLESEQRLREAVKIITEYCGESHSDLAKVYYQLAILDLLGKETKGAEEKLLQSYRIYEDLPKIYPDYLATLMKLNEICQQSKEEGRALLYAEKAYQYAEKLQPNLLLEVIMRFLDAALTRKDYHSALPHVDAMSATIANLDDSYSGNELEQLDYVSLEGILKIKKLKQKLLEVQIMSYFSEHNQDQILGMTNEQVVMAINKGEINKLASKLLETGVSGYKWDIALYQGEINKLVGKLLKTDGLHRPDLIELISGYSKVIDNGQRLLDEIRTHVSPRNAIETLFLKAIEAETSPPDFDSRHYLRNTLEKYSINCENDEEFEQLLELTGQFPITMDLAAACITIGKSKSVKAYCDFLQSVKSDLHTSLIHLNDTCTYFLFNFSASKLILVNEFKTLAENEAHYTELINNDCLFYLMHLIGDKAPKDFFRFALIHLGLTEEHANHILLILFNLNWLTSENEFIHIRNFVGAILSFNFHKNYIIYALQKLIIACYLYLEKRDKVNAEWLRVMDIYCQTLLKLHVPLNKQKDDMEMDIVIFFRDHLLNLCRISNNLQRFDQNTYLKLLIELYDKYDLNKNSKEYAEIITLLAFAEYHASNYHQKLKLLQEAHAIKAQLYEKDDPLYARSLYDLANAFGNIGDSSKRLTLGTEALEIFKRDYNLTYPSLSIEERAEKEINILNTMETLANGYLGVDKTRHIELLRECINFYNDHHLDRPNIKERTLRALMEVYQESKMPVKMLDVYESLESLQKQLYQEGTQAYAYNAGSTLLWLASSLNISIDFNVIAESEGETSIALEMNVRSRQAVSKAIQLLSAFYPEDNYLLTNAHVILAYTNHMEDYLIVIQKWFEVKKRFSEGNLDQSKILCREIVQVSNNPMAKSMGLSSIATIDFIKAKKNDSMTQQIRDGIFKQYHNAIETYDSANVQMMLSMAYFIYNYYEQAIIHAENAIQRLTESSSADMSFEEFEIPILPIAIQMALKDKIEDIPIKFLARYIIINSAGALGNIHSEMQNLEEFALLLSSDDSAISYLLLGFCYMRQGNWRLALQTFGDVFRKQPDVKLVKVSFALAQFCIKISDSIDVIDMCTFKEIQVINTIISDSNLTQQLIEFTKQDTPIDVNYIKKFIKAIK
ncbi:2088_t:CDS:2 [Funneliformis caledonium]|uniref:2088_t:CDS:1 n=1 Tax=Funneliformis caledonium TaxID=1117310 RepID=A0A9N8ZE10_9GLOM|nr:2088_t:CDS:2 [Funneliformis caledonium]